MVFPDRSHPSNTINAPRNGTFLHIFVCCVLWFSLEMIELFCRFEAHKVITVIWARIYPLFLLVDSADSAIFHQQTALPSKQTENKCSFIKQHQVLIDLNGIR